MFTSFILLSGFCACYKAKVRRIFFVVLCAYFSCSRFDRFLTFLSISLPFCNFSQKQNEYPPPIVDGYTLRSLYSVSAMYNWCLFSLPLVILLFNYLLLMIYFLMLLSHHTFLHD